MKKINDLEAALMGLLNEKPMHPYEIEKVIVERDMRWWTTISMSSVYKLLRKLEKEGRVKSEVRLNRRNLAQKVYHLTPAGRKALVARVKALASEWTRPVWPVDIALSNLRLLTDEEVAACFRQYEDSLDKMIECYGRLQEYLEAHCPLPNVQLAVRPLALMRAEKQWVRGFMKQYGKKRKGGQAGSAPSR
ncbi:MAG TPA: PadR family transcriptional regulator [Kiritimatiellia bacterium]|nr:PadR family transcriptional regulator [Kiritimatiellia bacterium]HRZ13528.1 PadR family transcriptional regulator [Kiritimatiellia bacterium]HSA19167.1 PadR family transcriptional regulator [Kiritimatiellia bacterium]